ncbi:ATP-dependent zinc metalloprotease FtsH [bacterium]|nr:ATP-dependent zinc metalloprotease FtsH [bacterium]
MSMSFLSMYKSGGGMAGGDIFSIGKSPAKFAKTSVRFSDVGGIGEEKYELQEIVDFLKKPSKYASMGARIPKGVILYGPPGTGKTLLAKAVAGEAGVPFLETNGSSFEDMLVGVGAKRVRDLFARAKKSAPSIIFIDEIDSVAGKRSNSRVGDNGLANQTINELLSQMDGFNSKSGVIVIAATNRLDMLDDAILRPGRFDRQIPVNLPDIDERVDILKIHSRNKNISAKVSLEDVARRTPGFSGAQLENVLNEAALLAVRHDSNTITLGDIDEAIDRVVGGPAKHNRKTSFEEKKQISFHEAGHALVGLNVKGADIVEKITIIPRGKAAGYTLQTPSIQELQIQKKSDLLGLVASTLGGRACEEIIYGIDSISTGASNDLYKATRIVRAMVTQLGMTDVGLMQYVPSEGEVNPYKTDYSEKTAQEIDNKINEILYERYDFAKKIITENKRELELIVESLLILETIDRKQIEHIHKQKDLPPEVKAKIDYLVKTNQLDEAYLFEEEKIKFIPNYESNKHQTNKDQTSTNSNNHEDNQNNDLTNKDKTDK